jgi:hypothetical protein
MSRLMVELDDCKHFLKGISNLATIRLFLSKANAEEIKMTFLRNLRYMPSLLERHAWLPIKHPLLMVVSVLGLIINL